MNSKLKAQLLSEAAKALGGLRVVLGPPPESTLWDPWSEGRDTETLERVIRSLEQATFSRLRDALTKVIESSGRNRLGAILRAEAEIDRTLKARSSARRSRRHRSNAADSSTCAPARHSSDYRSVHWFGTDYNFTPTQAPVVTALWAAWENGTPELGHATLFEASGSAMDSSSGRLLDIFRDHPAWMTMIVSGSTKGSYRLQEPKNPEIHRKTHR